MGDTKINWTDKSWNPIVGCEKISQGCKNCYAKTLHDMRHKAHKEGKQLPKQYAEPFEKIQLLPERLEQPLHWKKPQMIFVNSMSDLFHEKVPFEFIGDAYDIIYRAAQHIFQVLTKRPDRALEFYKWMARSVKSAGLDSIPTRSNNIFDYLEVPKNLWLGVSVENQKAADERIPLLLQTPAAVRWLSVEPMLENIVLASNVLDKARYFETGIIDWIVIGAESGNKRRPCYIQWIESLVDQCKSLNVPVFVKQMEVNGKVTDDINLFPEHLRIRQYPEAHNA
jgi:protein gp37